MWTDVVFSLGAILLAWGLLRAVSSLLERYGRRQALAMLAMGSGMVFLAHSAKPGGYSLDQAPQVLISVATQLF